ncbi:hypothetical protein NONI108955_22380 [Nocardia ninae]
MRLHHELYAPGGKTHEAVFREAMAIPLVEEK